MLALLCFFPSCRKAEDWDEGLNDPRLSGGTQTVFTQGVGAFSSAFPFMIGDRLDFHELGDGHFEATFVSAPAPLFSGLGPLYNNNACVNCHVNDGRGKPINGNEPMISMLFRVSVMGEDVHGGPLGAPGYGGQLQDKSTSGYQKEASVSVNWIDTTFQYSNGESVLLRKPIWSFNDSYIPMPAGWLYSARIAPPLHGLGLLEQISESDMEYYSDEWDSDSDGISGRINHVWDEQTGTTKFGRFGWKCEAPTLVQQVAGAYNEDMGVTSYVLRKENALGQAQYDEMVDEPEVEDSIFNSVVFYIQTLAVPARRQFDNPQVLHGEQLFLEVGCASCHIPNITTQVNVAFPEASHQYIHPYTDLLLHDMGPGLSDQRPAFDASGSEWRTPPLWGIGLTQIVNGHQFFLHDGRAQNLEEAILWHGGEAATSLEMVKNMSKADRDALIAFLNSL